MIASSAIRSSPPTGRSRRSIFLRSGQSNLVFTDVVMPGPITCRELADRARMLQPEVKVLFTSGYTQNAVVHGGRLDDGVELISKPYRRQQLARRLRRLLARLPDAELTSQSLPDHSNKNLPVLRSTSAGVTNLLSEDQQLVLSCPEPPAPSYGQKLVTA